MAFVAQRLGVGIVSVPEMEREVSFRHDARSIQRLAEVVREQRPHPAHSHGEGRRDQPRGGAARRKRGLGRPAHVPRARAQGYFGTTRTAFFREVERTLARVSDALIAVSPEVRDELVELGVAPREKFAVIRLGIPLEERLGDPTADLDYRRLYGIPEGAFVVGWVGRMTGVKDTASTSRSSARRATAGSTRCSASSATAPTARLEQVAHDLGIARHCFSSVIRRTSPATTGCSTRSCSRP